MMKKRILVADDEATVVKILKDRFANWGYEVETASDGEETLEKVENFKPHLLLLDLKMPKISGIEILDRTKKKRPQIGILILTASQSKSTFRTCLEKGADGYMLKPFKPENIRDYVEKILRTTEKGNTND
jgi:two-component system alkaline phosphatase synthesis response regulator PhoP